MSDTNTNTMQTLIDAIIQEKGNVVRRKDIINIGAARGYNTTEVWKHLCRADMRSPVRGQFDLTKYNGGPVAKARSRAAAAPKKETPTTTDTPSTTECL